MEQSCSGGVSGSAICVGLDHPQARDLGRLARQSGFKGLFSFGYFQGLLTGV